MKLFDFGIIAIIFVLVIGLVTGAEIQNDKHVIPSHKEGQK